METDLLRALRTYINKSKRKRLSKRETAKMVVMELVLTRRQMKKTRRALQAKK